MQRICSHLTTSELFGRGSRLEGTPLADGGVALEARVLRDGGDVRDAEGVHDEFALKQHFVVEHRVG